MHFLPQPALQGRGWQPPARPEPGGLEGPHPGIFCSRLPGQLASNLGLAAQGRPGHLSQPRGAPAIPELVRFLPTRAPPGSHGAREGEGLLRVRPGPSDPPGARGGGEAEAPRAEARRPEPPARAGSHAPPRPAPAPSTRRGRREPSPRSSSRSRGRRRGPRVSPRQGPGSRRLRPRGRWGRRRGLPAFQELAEPAVHLLLRGPCGHRARQPPPRPGRPCADPPPGLPARARARAPRPAHLCGAARPACWAPW